MGRKIENPLQRALFYTLVISLLGLYLCICIGDPISNPWPFRNNIATINIFYCLFKRNEPTVLFFLIGVIVLIFLNKRVLSKPIATSLCSLFSRVETNYYIIGISSFALCFTLLGTHKFFHNFALCMDEYLVDFQAQIFLGKKLVGNIPSCWTEFVYAMTPDYVQVSNDNTYWVPQYLPGFAAFKAAFIFLRIPSLLNPLMCAISLVSIADIAKKIWPQNKHAPVLAAILLFSSSQFLLTSMTVYSWPAHLCLNLVWLWLYIRDDRMGLILLPWVGIMAIGLHRPQVHALFALPFLLRMLKTKHWHTVCYVASVYFFGCCIWLLWIKFILPVSIDRSFASEMGIPGIMQVHTRMMNLVYLVSWQNLASSVLAIVFFIKWRQMPPILKDIAFGFLLTFGFYLFLRGTGGHGWGARHIHSALGNMVLLSVGGFYACHKAQQSEYLYRFLIFSTALACLVQLPIRCMQAESFVRPYAKAMANIESIKAPVVVVDDLSVYYGQDLIRNDPFLRSEPIIMSKRRLTEDQLTILKDRYPVKMVGQEKLVEEGLPPVERDPLRNL